MARRKSPVGRGPGSPGFRGAAAAGHLPGLQPLRRDVHPAGDDLGRLRAGPGSSRRARARDAGADGGRRPGPDPRSDRAGAVSGHGLLGGVRRPRRHDRGRAAGRIPSHTPGASGSVPDADVPGRSPEHRGGAPGGGGGGGLAARGGSMELLDLRDLRRRQCQFRIPSGFLQRTLRDLRESRHGRVEDPAAPLLQLQLRPVRTQRPGHREHGAAKRLHELRGPKHFAALVGGRLRRCLHLDVRQC